MEKGMEKGKSEGREEERHTMVIQAHKAGMSNTAIADMFNLELAEVEKILEGAA